MKNILRLLLCLSILSLMNIAYAVEWESGSGAINCSGSTSASCDIRSGLGCITNTNGGEGQCGFPKSSALKQCEEHSQCAALTCHPNGYCYARSQREALPNPVPSDHTYYRPKSMSNAPSATNIPSSTLPTPIGGKARVSLGGGGASASALLISRRLTIKSEAWSDSARKGTKASVQVVISDKSGNQIYTSPLYNIPTACSSLDTCPSQTSQKWNEFIPAGIEHPNASSLAIYLKER